MNTYYYVYILLDPRRLYQPFYVGKGKGTRWKDHFKKNNGRNYLKNSVIRKIIKAGLEPSVLLWETELSEERSFDLERELISRFGRRNLGTGILTNLTDGGEGLCGKVFSEAERHQISDRVSGTGNPMYGKTHTDDAKNRMSIKQRGKAGTPHSEEWRQHLRENNAGGKATARSIYQIGIDGTIIQEWPSAQQAAKQLHLSNANICDFAEIDSFYQCGGFWWRRVGSPDVVDGVLLNHEALKLRLDRPHAAKSVSQIDPDTGEVMRVWVSFREAADELGLQYAALWAAEKYNRFYAGYKWSKIA